MTTASHSAPLQVAYQSAPAYFNTALITPIRAPPAINPEAISVPRSRRILFTFSSLLRVDTYQLTSPPINKGVFRSNGIISCYPLAFSRINLTSSRRPYTVISPAIAKASRMFTFSLEIVNVPGRATSPITEIL